MSKDLIFDFSVNKDECSITVKKEFAAGRDLIWDAFTKPKLMDQWWAPKPWKAKTLSMDFKEGGKWQYVMCGPEGEEHGALIEFDKIKEKEMYSGTDGFADKDGKVLEDMPQSTWQISFSDHKENTLMVSKIIFPDQKQLETTLEMGFKEGYTIALNGLDELLEEWK